MVPASHVPGGQTGGDRPPLLSVIIPVYNTAAYLESCIQSLLDQDEPDLEIIAVDDGSTDDSRQILDKIARSDARLRVFSKENGGQGSARNYGLSEARGRYIAFVDSDDTVATNLLSQVAPYLSDPAIDVVSFGIDFRDTDGRTVASRGVATEFLSTGETIFLDAMIDRNFLSSACNKVYRRELLSEYEISFPELRAYEDSVFSRRVALHARKVLYLNRSLYFALTRHGSTSRGMRKLSFSMAAEMITLEWKMFAIDTASHALRTAFRAHVAHFFAYLIILSAFRIDDPAERRACRQIADLTGFSDCATDPQALSLLGARKRAQILLARHPRLLRMVALVARRLNRVPY